MRSKRTDKLAPDHPQTPRDAHDLRTGRANPDAPLPDAYTVEPRDDAGALLGSEWLLTDGLGGYAMGTALGAPTRRWHALLVGATNPPVGRVCAWNATVDTLALECGEPNERRVELSTFRFGDGLLHPDSHARLASFERFGLRGEREPACRWTLREGGATVTRTLELLWKVGGARLAYTVTGAARAELRVAPLVSLRRADELLRRSDGFEVHAIEASCVVVRRHGRTLRLRATGARFVHAPDWWTNFRYDKERERQYDCEEDLFTPGAFVCETDATGEGAFEIVAELERGRASAGGARPRSRSEHLRTLVHAVERDAPGGALGALACAADDFVVERTVGGRAGATIIAGYPWFADWGRDAMIALPGLLLTTGRFNDARSVLNTFSAHIRNGLVPNCYDEHSGEPLYNSVDASLWFLRAACEFAAATSERAAPTLPDELLARCLDVVDHFVRGTDFGIGVDERDGLLRAGDEHTQLTWMDAKRDGVVFTPRFGKCVELNALWVHCLRALADLVNVPARSRRDDLLRRADAAASSFTRLFWRERMGCLADRLTPEHSGEGVRWTPVDEVRPNQLFAAALERSPLSAAQRRAVVSCAREMLLTPRGVRTLAPGSPCYRARYEGTMFERDGAYHNGTAWPWLIGAYCEGALRAGAFDASSRAEAQRALAPILKSMREGCIGQIGEVADADAPQREDGCPAQAWSVAEALRISAMLSR